MSRWIEEQIESAAVLLDSVRRDPAALDALENICRTVVDCFERGGKVLTLGNGGSATAAAHLAEELIGRFRSDRPALPAMSLTAEPAILTCIANDFGFDQIFARQLQALAAPADLVVAFSTSGRSANVVAALRGAKEKGCVTVGLLGGDGGPALPLCDHAFVVPHRDTARIQEIHTLALHLICEAAERRYHA